MNQSVSPLGPVDGLRFERDPQTGHIHARSGSSMETAFCGAVTELPVYLGASDWFATEGWREPAICARCRREVAPVEASR